MTTDAVNRAPRGSFGEVTGVTQTVRYFAASLGLAVLGSVMIREAKSDVGASLTRQGLPHSVVTKVVASIDSGPGAHPSSSATSAVFATVQHDFAHSVRIVYLAMAGIMACSAVVARRGMERGVPVEVAEAPDTPAIPEGVE